MNTPEALPCSLSVCRFPADLPNVYVFFPAEYFHSLLHSRSIHFLQTNRIPPELRESMQEHLRLHFDTQDASDEQVSGCTSLPPGRTQH